MNIYREKESRLFYFSNNQHLPPHKKNEFGWRWGASLKKHDISKNYSPSCGEKGIPFSAPSPPRISMQCRADGSRTVHSNNFNTKEKHTRTLFGTIQRKDKKKICYIFLGKLYVECRSEYSQIALMWRFFTQNMQEFPMKALSFMVERFGCFCCEIKLRSNSLNVKIVEKW